MNVNVHKPFICLSVHGGYSEWSEWGSCTVSCGAGIQKRLRQCNNPLPANGGRHCAGSDTEIRSCQGNPCPGQCLKILKLRFNSFLNPSPFIFVPFQWMETGLSGPPGKSAHRPVVRATELGSEPAATPHLNIEGSHVRATQWKPLCAASGHVLVRKSQQNRVCFLNLLIYIWSHNVIFLKWAKSKNFSSAVMLLFFVRLINREL